MFVAALLPVAANWKSHQCPATRQPPNKLSHTHSIFTREWKYCRRMPPPTHWGDMLSYFYLSISFISPLLSSGNSMAECCVPWRTSTLGHSAESSWLCSRSSLTWPVNYAELKSQCLRWPLFSDSIWITFWKCKAVEKGILGTRGGDGGEEGKWMCGLLVGRTRVWVLVVSRSISWLNVCCSFARCYHWGKLGKGHMRYLCIIPYQSIWIYTDLRISNLMFKSHIVF